MIPYTEWLDQAQRLKQGRSVRVEHICGEGTPLIIEHTADGFRCHCFRCNDGGFKPHGQRALHKILEQWKQADEQFNPFRIQLPSDATQDFTWPGNYWLSRSGITNHLRDYHGIRYSPSCGRVFLPIYSDPGINSRLLYFQGRAVHEGQTPKYLNPATGKDRPIFTAFAASGSCTDTGVVTEDYLSAVRIGAVRHFTGVSILGTSANTGTLVKLASFPRIVIWLDPDPAGRKGALKLQRSLELMGKKVTTLAPEFEPKNLTHAKLEEYLWQHLT